MLYQQLKIKSSVEQQTSANKVVSAIDVHFYHFSTVEPVTKKAAFYLWRLINSNNMNKNSNNNSKMAEIYLILVRSIAQHPTPSTL